MPCSRLFDDEMRVHGDLVQLLCRDPGLSDGRGRRAGGSKGPRVRGSEGQGQQLAGRQPAVSSLKGLIILGSPVQIVPLLISLAAGAELPEVQPLSPDWQVVFSRRLRHSSWKFGIFTWLLLYFIWAGQDQAGQRCCWRVFWPGEGEGCPRSPYPSFTDFRDLNFLTSWWWSKLFLVALRRKIRYYWAILSFGRNTMI